MNDTYQPVLFIGGESDGQWRTVPTNVAFYRVPARLHEFVETSSGESPRLEPLFYEAYRRECISCPTNEWIVYVLETMLLEDMIQMLINGYHQPVTA